VFPFFERANANVHLFLNRPDKWIVKTKTKKTTQQKEKKDVHHHNKSKQNVILDGKPFKCNGVMGKVMP
jgi:hypothetical protein